MDGSVYFDRDRTPSDTQTPQPGLPPPGFQVLVPRAGSVEVPVPVPRELPPLHRKSCNVEVPGSGSTHAMKFQGSKPYLNDQSLNKAYMKILWHSRPHLNQKPRQGEMNLGGRGDTRPL